MVIENTVTPEWTGTNHMAVSQNVPSLGINHKTGSLTAH
jgi:hypothetical protein